MPGIKGHCSNPCARFENSLWRGVKSSWFLITADNKTTQQDREVDVTRDDARRVVTTMLDARLKGDVDQMMHHFDDNCNFAFAGSTPPGTLARKSVSRKEMSAQLAALVAEWPWTKYELEEFVFDDDVAVLVVTQHITHSPTGNKDVAEVVDIIRFKNGKIVAMREYIDTARAERLIKKST